MPSLHPPGPSSGSQASRTRRGYTLVQLMVVVVIAAVAIYFMTTILMNTQNAFSSGVTTETAQATAVRIANEVAAELKDAILPTMYTCSYCKNHISFQKNLGHDAAGNVIASNWIYYWYQWNDSYYDPGVGEGKVVRWENGRWGPIGQGVKATNPDTGLPGFCITRSGNAVTVSVTVELKDNQNKPVRYTATTTVTPLTQ